MYLKTLNQINSFKYESIDIFRNIKRVNEHRKAKIKAFIINFRTRYSS